MLLRNRLLQWPNIHLSHRQITTDHRFIVELSSDNFGAHDWFTIDAKVGRIPSCAMLNILSALKQCPLVSQHSSAFMEQLVCDQAMLTWEELVDLLRL